MKSVYVAATAGLITLGLALPAAANTAACKAPSRAEVERQFEAFNDAWATKDPDKVAALFTKDAVLLATVSNTPRTTPEGVRDYFVSFLKGSPIGTINTSTVKVDCNTAARVGAWTVSLIDQKTGIRNDVKARYSFIYKWEKGAWKIDHLHSSMMPEAGK